MVQRMPVAVTVARVDYAHVPPPAKSPSPSLKIEELTIYPVMIIVG